MELEKVKGNLHAKKILKDSLEKGHFLHNYLFLGPDHEGKLEAAHILAQAILCQSEPKPCGQCPSCKLYQSSPSQGENHPDLLEIFPTKTSSRESIKKSSVVDIIESTVMKPYKGQAKVYIVHGFETMTPEGQNALLKTLEEPLHGVHFILLAKSKEAILPTVLSRSSQIYFEGLREEDIYQVLKDQGYSSAIIDQLVAYGAGSYSRAFALARDPGLNQLRNQVFQMIHRVVTQPGYSALASWDFFANHENELRDIFFFLESWARDIIVYNLSASRDRLSNRDYEDQIVEAAQQLGSRSQDIMEIILRTWKYLENNGNKQLVIEGMLLEIGG